MGDARDSLEAHFRALEGNPATPEVARLLDKHGFPLGLARQMVAASSFYPVRMWIVDNSGSMNATDGERLATDQAGVTKVLRTTRWEELANTIISVGTISHLLGARMEFYPLNPSDCPLLTISGENEDDVATVTSSVQELKPGGTTPLTQAVQRIIAAIDPSAPRLQAGGQQACVVIATDGQPDDPGSFQQALQQLQRLPVWVIVRLCTDDDDVVDYYSSLDRQLEAPLEVLDDVLCEAREIDKVNCWLAYGPQLHLAREFGMRNRLFDTLDERPMLPSQIKAFCEALLGCSRLPEPELELEAFLAALDVELSPLVRVFNPVKKLQAQWINRDLVEAHIRVATTTDMLELAALRMKLMWR